MLGIPSPHECDDPERVFYPTEHLPPTTLAERNLSVALRLADHWLHVHPCNSNKAPTISWGKDADRIGKGSSHDSRVINNWFGGGRVAIPGINAGKSNLLVIDCDRKPNKPDGVAAFWELAARHGGIPDACPIVSTPSNGRHVYFRQPDGAPFTNRTGALPPGIDVRGVGGQVIAPGACLPDGREWEHVAGSPDLAEAYATNTIPQLPEWLAAILRTPKASEQPAEEQPLTTNGTPAGARERAWAERALEGVATHLAAARAGGRNQALNASAYRLGRIVARRWLSDSEVRAVLEDACRANGLWKDGPREVRATIASGLHGGLASPHEDLPDRDDGDPSVAQFAAQLGRTLVEDEDGTLHDPETGEVFEPGVRASAESVEVPDRRDFAEAILERDGLVPAIARWILSVSRRPQKRLAVASALAAVATAASRQLQTPTHSNLNLYVVMIAPSGAGKEAPMKAAIELLLQAGLPEMIGPDGFQSDTSIYDKLRQQPACLAAINEFGSYLAVATARQAPAHIQKLLAALRKFYDGGTLSPPHAATRPSEVLFNPCLTILGSSTPMQFYSAITGAQTEDGTLNRFVTVTARGNPAKFDTSSCPTDVPPYLRQMMQRLADRPGGVNCYMFRTPLQPESYQLKPETVSWTDEAREQWNAYEDANSLRMAGNPSMDGFAARCPLNALRIATVLAIGENIESPLVTTEHIDIAKTMVEASLRDMVRGYDENAVETPESRLADRIRRTLAKNGGSMGRSDLVQCLKRHIRSTKNLDEVLGVLIEAHEIAVVAPTVGDKGGRPGKRYQLLI